jgi:hypothetical protein
VLDHLSRQVEAVGAAHAFGEDLDDAGQADDGAVDLAPQFDVAVTSVWRRVLPPDTPRVDVFGMNGSMWRLLHRSGLSFKCATPKPAGRIAE